MSWSTDEWRAWDKRYAAEGRYLVADLDERTTSTFYPDTDRSLNPAMDAYLHGRGLDAGLARRFGWYPGWYNGPRIIVPCVRSDTHSFWQGRLIDNLTGFKYVGEYKRWDSPKGPRHDAVCYTQVGGSTLVLVEGPFDSLAAAECGHDSIAVLGLGMSKSVVGHIASLVSGRYMARLVVPDSDAFGPWVKIQASLTNHGEAFEIRSPAPYKDLAEMPILERKLLLA